MPANPCDGLDRRLEPGRYVRTVGELTYRAVNPANAGGDDPADNRTRLLLGEELVGRWAHYDVVAYEDGLLKTLIISYGFNDFTEVDGRITDQASFCFSEQRTDQPIETSLSDAATQAIRPPSTPVEVDEVDGVLRIRRSATPTPVGIRLEDPANESLPTDPADPRIVDDDGDGKPGLTVTIRVTDDLTRELYIARRENFAYEAFLTEPDVLTGRVTDDSEQLVIGASDPIFAVVGRQLGAVSRPRQEPDHPEASRRRLGLRLAGRRTLHPVPTHSRRRLVSPIATTCDVGAIRRRRHQRVVRRTGTRARRPRRPCPRGTRSCRRTTAVVGTRWRPSTRSRGDMVLAARVAGATTRR